jgi:hypothetical protein
MIHIDNLYITVASPGNTLYPLPTINIECESVKDIIRLIVTHTTLVKNKLRL